MVKKLVIYGAGKRCKVLCKLLQQTNVEIVAVLDGNSDKWGLEVEGYQIQSPETICSFLDANICITVANVKEVRAIREKLYQIYKYELNKEIHYIRLILDIYIEDSEVRRKILEGKVQNKYREKSILFACTYGFGLGGIEAWTKDICEALIKSGHENVYIISGKGEYDIPPLLKNHMICVDIHSNRDYLKESIMNLIEAIVKMLPCIFITTTTEEITLAACLVKHYFPDMIDIISTIRGSNERIYQDHMDIQEYPSIHIGVSQDIKNDLIQFGIEPEKVYSMCVPFECEETLNRTYNRNYSMPIRIGYAGRMIGMETAAKRLDLLMKLALLLAERKINYILELAGDGPARQEMEKFVCAHNLEEQVKFLGRLDRSEIPAFWKNQDICVNISDFEGRCHSIIEAMGNGAVPVVTATSGVREDITDDVNGYIVPIEDYHAMAERIEYLSQHRERLSQMGQIAHDVVYPKSQIESHLAFWEDILARN